MSLSYDEIAEILRIIDSSSCDEFIVETGDIKLVVRRNGATGAAELVNNDAKPARPRLLVRRRPPFARRAPRRQRPRQARAKSK